MEFEDWLSCRCDDPDEWLFWYAFYHGVKFFLTNPDKMATLENLDLWNMLA